MNYKRKIGFLILFTLAFLGSCKDDGTLRKNYFDDKKGCFLLYDLNEKKVVKVINEENCKIRYVPCSTFKVPLAVMAFDSHVLKDENVTLKWDGKKNFIESHNQDHNAVTWLRDSVVWFSQKLTPEIGASKIQKYLNGFQYGNKDISAGLTTFWLVEPFSNSPSLLVSAEEQMNFLKNLWTEELPASKDAMKLVKNIINQDISPKGFKLKGKTGSQNFGEGKKFWVGWFVSYLISSDGKKEYIAITNFIDLVPTPGKSYGGLRAKEITKNILEDEGLW